VVSSPQGKIDGGRSLPSPSAVQTEGIGTVNIEIEREDDGRWIAEVPDLPGVMVYGHSREEAISRVKALALRVLADRLENGETIPELGGVFAVLA
jgi:predicted RNase H-like HicB family nuclease